jgi:hypothetical protein
MFDINEDVTPVDDDGNNLPNQTHLDNDEESYVSVERPTMVEEDFDNENNIEDEEDFPPVIRDKFSGIFKNIRMLQTFYNQRPQDEWKDECGEAAF